MYKAHWPVPPCPGYSVTFGVSCWTAVPAQGSYSRSLCLECAPKAASPKPVQTEAHGARLGESFRLVHCRPLPLPMRKSRPREIVSGPMTTRRLPGFREQGPRSVSLQSMNWKVTGESTHYLFAEHFEHSPCDKASSALGTKRPCPRSGCATIEPLGHRVPLLPISSSVWSDRLILRSSSSSESVVLSVTGGQSEQSGS